MWKIASTFLVSMIAAALWRPSLAMFNADRGDCFCSDLGTVDECSCSVNSVDLFNNQKVWPLLERLLKRDYFRYYKVNIDKSCPFWPDDRFCATRQCGVETCDDSVPETIKKSDCVCTDQEKPSADIQTQNNETESSKAKDKSESDDCPPTKENAFDPLDRQISGEAQQQFDRWADFDNAETNKFCLPDQEELSSPDMHYVDLTRNPKRWTGYKGGRVWAAIYSENCFKPSPRFDPEFLRRPSTSGLCLEKRVFHRIISGLHASISVSIAANSFHSVPGFPGQGTWGPDLKEFRLRFAPEATWSQGPQRLKNMYFLYMLQARALLKAAPYINAERFFTGNKREDAETRRLVSQFHQTLGGFHGHFDETAMFQLDQSIGADSAALFSSTTNNYGKTAELKEEFRNHFLNISRIMDCVDCDKCRLWGKVQMHGIGTALQILLTPIPSSSDTDAVKNSYSTVQNEIAEEGEETIANDEEPPFQLTRNELVALFNAFGRFSVTINELDDFRNRMMKSNN